MTAKVLAFGSIIFLSACALERNAINVGSNDAGGDIRTAVPGPDDTEACRNGPQLPIVGHWEGYIENFKLGSGSDAIQITVSSATSAQACGKVKLGTAAPPPPPTDPAKGYPPGYVHPQPLDAVPTIEMTEGFPMTILEGAASSARMQFTTDSHEFWKSWCQLQTSIALSTGGYDCASEGGLGPDGCEMSDGHGNRVPVDCWKLSLCLNRVCACTEAGCTSRTQPNFSFDLSVSGNGASGSVGISGRLHNVHLTQSK